MQKLIPWMVCAAFLLQPAGSLLAQEPPPPPNILQIYREQIKPGRAGVHAMHEQGWPRAFARAGFTGYYLAMQSVTGPQEAWYLAGTESFASVEQNEKAIEANPALQAELEHLGREDAEYLSGLHVILARYRADMSYGPRVSIPTMRYFDVTILRVRPGHETSFGELNKLVIEAHQQANVDERWATFEVVSGMPDGTFLVFTPMKSLAEMDTVAARHGTAFQQAIAPHRQKLTELQRAGILSTESMVFALSPRMSYMPDDFKAVDPAFWNPKD